MPDVICPTCKSVCQFQQNLGPGVTVRCSSCQKAFAYPGLGIAPPARAMATGTKQCPFCAEEIRIEAKKCKHCGEMLEQIAPPARDGRKVQTIEATGKLWKVVQAIGVFGVMVAAVVFFLSFYPDKAPFAEDWKYPGAWGIVSSLGVWGIGRAGAWWFHG